MAEACLNVVRSPGTDSRHATATYKLSWYYYCLLLILSPLSV